MNPNIPKSEHLEWTGSFYNDNLAFDHYEILMINRVPKKERLVEARLMNTKWYDYRLMHPMYTTYYFYHLYVREYQAYWAKTINCESAPFIYPFKGEARLDFLRAREAMSIWRLRQAADTLGIRYEFFIKTAFNKMYRMIAGGRVIPPRPSMFNKEEFIADIYIAWLDNRKATLQYACSPYFQVLNFNHSLIQREHERFMIEQVKQRSIPYYSLSTCLHTYGLISIEAAMQSFDQQTLQMAINHTINF